MPSCLTMSMSNTQWLVVLLRAHFWRKQKRAFFSLLPSRPPINKGSSSGGDSLGMAMAIKDLSSQTPAHQSHHPPLLQLLDPTLVPQFSCPILQPTTPLRKAKNRPQIRAHSRHSWSNPTKKGGRLQPPFSSHSLSPAHPSACATASAVIPSSLNTVFPGALIPNRSIPIT